MAAGIFITGTDTGVGKTLIACALIRTLRERGLWVAGMKPVASGSDLHADGLRNADALQLQAAASVKLPYEVVNPYVFAPPIAPHLAASLAGTTIDLEKLDEAYERCAANADIVVVEGAGGWRLPLGEGRFLSDFAERQRFDVVLVVGLRLGCLNHATLTAEAVEKGQCKLVGWIGNQIDPAFPYLEENFQTLEELLKAPCLGRVAHLSAPQLAIDTPLDLTPILEWLRSEKSFGGA